ncbi:hypothetical protein PVAG01_02115 [Phlyctema vagabunda]|uniref:Uncharacterized protein n=1 Tax=Phlyctema vagabunda TaxID=108571 RepID=A0ABR4PPN6_9HELO
MVGRRSNSTDLTTSHLRCSTRWRRILAWLFVSPRHVLAQ